MVPKKRHSELTGRGGSGSSLAGRSLNTPRPVSICDHKKLFRIGIQQNPFGKNLHLANCRKCGTTLTVPESAGESYKKIKLHGESFIRYKFFTACGKLFTCMAFSLKGARYMRDEWLMENGLL